jgi:hypothetical protein
MCTVKTPKVVPVSRDSEKPLNILRNPYLDGMDPSKKSKSVGLGSLRINRQSAGFQVGG